VLDPSSQTIQGINVTTSTSGGATTSTAETQYNISYSYTNGAGATVNVNDVSVWQATCQYDTYSPNTFIDSLGLTIGGTTYSNSHPYYGPYLENSGFSFNVNGSGVVSSSGTTTVTTQSLPCEAPYDFVSGENFNGPVYTNDQLHVCGSPTFNGSPVSLTSGAPSDVPYLYQVPGSVLVTAANSGTNGPYPTSLIGDYVPEGYTVDSVNCGGSGANPNIAHGVSLNGTQSLPSLNSALAQYGTSSPPSGTTGTGCSYVGPTMIQLVTTGTTTTMNVWSPLSTTRPSRRRAARAGPRSRPRIRSSPASPCRVTAWSTCRTTRFRRIPAGRPSRQVFRATAQPRASIPISTRAPRRARSATKVTSTSKESCTASSPLRPAPTSWSRGT
jgi:hypothetical protein